MLRSYPRIWGSSFRHLWARHSEAIRPLSCLVAIAVATAALGGKPPMALPLVDLSLAALDFASVIAVLEIAMLVGLVLLASRAGKVIERQRQAIQDSGSLVAQLAAENESLLHRLSASRLRSVEEHEASLLLIGSKLHDRSAQPIEDALRNFHTLSPGTEGRPRPSLADYEMIKTALDASLAGIRCISADLKRTRNTRT